MAEDKIYIKCPECGEDFVFYTTQGPGEGISFSLHDAPFESLIELNEEADDGQVQCVVCDTFLKVPIKFCVYVTKFSENRTKLIWRTE